MAAYTIDSDATNFNLTTNEGGIHLNAGLGGVTIDTTNAFLVNANAESGITTTTGNVVFNTVGNFIANSTNTGAGGIGIADNTVAQTVNLGTGAAAKTLNIGNTTGATAVAVQAGTGGFSVDTGSGGALSLDATGASSNLTLATTGDAQDLTLAVTGSTDSSLVLSSAGTGTDSLRFNAVGGMDVDAGSYRLDTTGQYYVASSQAAGGAITLDAGSGGVTLTSGVSGTIIQTGAFAVMLLSTYRMFQRFGDAGLVQYQGTPTALADSDATLTTAQMLLRLFTGSPSATRTLTLDTAALVVSGLSGLAAINDAFRFTIINTSGTSNFTVAMGTGGTLVGSGTVTNGTSGSFLLRLTNVTLSTEAYAVYRV